MDYCSSNFRFSAEQIAILDFITQPVAVLHEDTIIFSNGCFAQLCACPREEATCRFFSSFVRPKHRNTVQRYLEQLTSNMSACSVSNVDFTFLATDGTEVQVEMHGQQIVFDDQRTILCTLSDVTERVKSTRALKRIMDAIPEVIFAFNRDHTVITSANSATEGIYGLPAEQFTSNIFHPIDLVLPDDAEMVHRFYRNLIDMEFERIEYRIVHANGEIRWVRDEGEVIYKEQGLGEIQQIYHFIRDITDRRQDVEKLQSSEEKYRRIFERSTDPIYVVTPHGDFLDINEAAIRLFGFQDKNEALGKNIREFYLDNEDRDFVIEAVRQNGSITDHPMRIRSAAGEIIDVMVTAGGRKNAKSGKLERYQVILHDIRSVIERTELETYRRTLGGISDRINNITQAQIMQHGLIRDYMQIFKTATPAMQEKILAKLEKAIDSSAQTTSDLQALGETVRSIYHKPEPPKPVSDGTGGILFDLKL